MGRDGMGKAWDCGTIKIDRGAKKTVSYGLPIDTKQGFLFAGMMQIKQCYHDIKRLDAFYLFGLEIRVLNCYAFKERVNIFLYNKTTCLKGGLL
jgi:hypothetical protein